MRQIILIAIFLMCGYFTMAELVIYPAPEGAPRSYDFNVLVNGQKLDLYASETRWGSNASFAYFDSDEEVEIDIIANFGPEHHNFFELLPRSLNIVTKMIENGHMRFTLDKPAHMTFVRMNDFEGRVLHLFCNPPEKEEIDINDDQVIYFGPGYHEIDEDSENSVILKSNQVVYIAGGAYVKGYIIAEGANNISVKGRGILGQDKSMKFRKRSLDFRNCTSISLEDIIVNRNRSGWSGYIYGSNDIKVNNWKVVSGAIWSTDGLNLANCSNAHYQHCYFRCADDNIAIKGLGNGSDHSSKTLAPDSFPPNKNILVEKCIFWSDNNNAIVLGQETLSSEYSNIIFKDCDVLFVRDDEPIKAVVSLICLHGTDFRNILFEDFRVGPSGQLIAVFFTEEIFRIKGNQQWSGSMENIVFRNFKTWGSGSKKIRVDGWDENNKIKNIVFDNIVINNDKVSAESDVIYKNEFVENLQVK